MKKLTFAEARKAVENQTILRFSIEGGHERTCISPPAGAGNIAKRARHSACILCNRVRTLSLPDSD